MKEFSIMPQNPYYETKRFPGSERHEIFEGRTGNRDKSIEDGLVIFIMPGMHRTSNDSIHLNPKKWEWLKAIAQKTWQDYYNKTEKEFRLRYGKNYL